VVREVGQRRVVQPASAIRLAQVFGGRDKLHGGDPRAEGDAQPGQGQPARPRPPARPAIRPQRAPQGIHTRAQQPVPGRLSVPGQQQQSHGQGQRSGVAPGAARQGAVGQPDHPGQPGGGVVGGERAEPGDQGAAQGVAQRADAAPEGGHAQRPGHLPHAERRPQDVRQRQQRHGQRAGQDEHQPVGRVEDRRLVVGQQRRTRAQVGIPRRQPPGA